MKNYNWNIEHTKIGDKWFFIDAYTPKLEGRTNDIKFNIKIQFDLHVSIRNEILLNLKQAILSSSTFYQIYS